MWTRPLRFARQYGPWSATGFPETSDALWADTIRPIKLAIGDWT